MPRLSKIGAAALAAFGWTSGTSAVTASYLVVAGGGGAGEGNGGGGGAGGLLTGTTSLNPTVTYTVTVGAGGTGAAATVQVTGTSGSNSQFGTLTASVGGGGGGTGYGAGSFNTGLTGGSGGGGGTNSGSGAAGTSGQGSTGGNGNNASSSSFAGGGGGGAGGTGATPANGTTTGGAGGVGLANSITGTSTYYAGGGGGGGGTGSGAGTGGAGGNGGGGSGSGNNTTGAAGTANTGGGGGGGGYIGGTNPGGGGNGGSGVVIISYASPQKFGGGIVTTSGANTIHTFQTSGTLSPLSTLSASYLIVAGGGAGGSSVSTTAWGGGGGGAGGYQTNSGVTIDTNSTYLVTVGSGGAGSSGNNGGYGTVSAFSIVTTSSVGGGGGAVANGVNGRDGGSGGGGTDGVGGTATSGQGNNGGAGLFATKIAGGGGGGAGAVGQNASNSGNTGGNGGIGLTSSISGTSTYYAGGGGGGGFSVAGTGGNGGGGAGSLTTVGTAGTANLGGGGGGGGGGAYIGGVGAGGNGGSGIVIISYAGSVQQMAGGTVTITGGNVIHTFNSSGYLTPLKLVNNSLRFRSSASAYLSRTPTVTGNQQKWTWSGWVKKSYTSGDNVLFGCGSGGTGDSTWTYLTLADNLVLNGYNQAWRVTSQVFRDPAAWYHIVVSLDTTQATANNRVKMYVNGSEITAFSTTNNPAQNANLSINRVAQHTISSRQTYSNDGYFDGYMTDINFIDGQALTPNSFGSFNSYGVWQPITYGGSYGTNGFYLPFTNKTSTTTLGYDFSPAGNNWTPNNISLTAGTTYDSMTDVPTLTSATAANYATYNPLCVPGPNGTASQGNLYISSAASGNGSGWTGTIPISSTGAKWYWEYTCGTVVSGYPIMTCYPTAYTGDNFGGGYCGMSAAGTRYNGDGTSNVGALPGYANGDVCMFAYDPSNGKTWMGKNGTWFLSGDPAAGTNPTTTATATQQTSFFPATTLYNGANCYVNFGQRPFSYTPPSGFVALNTYNL